MREKEKEKEKERERESEKESEKKRIAIKRVGRFEIAVSSKSSSRDRPSKLQIVFREISFSSSGQISLSGYTIFLNVLYRPTLLYFRLFNK